MTIEVTTSADTPRRHHRERSVQSLQSELTLKNRQLKILRQKIRRHEKRIASMKIMMNKLKKEKSCK